MVISDSKKFIFSHLYKAGGTSMRALLLPHGKENINGCHKHSMLKDIKKAIPEEIFNSYYKFSFVRNTWSWQVSLYEYMLADWAHPQRQLMISLGSFDNYVRWRVDGNVDLQKEYVYDDDGTLLADFVGRLENVGEDMGHVCNKLGLEYNLPHLNKQTLKPYRDYYTDETRGLFAEAYKEDIETFNFKF